MAAPVLVALFAIPMLIEGMGKERFGLLAIIWVGVGYFSLFDLGLGRALTKLVSERLGNDEDAELGGLVWTALTLLISLGVLGAGFLFVFSAELVGLLQVPESLSQEARGAFLLLAMGLPIVIVTAGLVGILQAHQRFKLIAQIRMPLGVLTFAGPLLSLQFTPSVFWATCVLLISRVVALIAYYLAASRVTRSLCEPRRPDRELIKPLLTFGGWLTVTNVIGPLMTYLDRFYVSAILGLSAVTYYVTPYEVLNRLQMLPKAIMDVVFQPWQPLTQEIRLGRRCCIRA